MKKRRKDSTSQVYKEFKAKFRKELEELEKMPDEHDRHRPTKQQLLNAIEIIKETFSPDRNANG